MNVNAWLVVAVCNVARVEEKDEGVKGGERDSPKKRTLHLAKMPCRVKCLTDTRKENPGYSNCSAGSSGLIHITCTSLFEASTARLCTGSLALLSGPLGLTCPPFAVQNKSPKTILSTLTMACRLQFILLIWQNLNYLKNFKTYTQKSSGKWLEAAIHFHPVSTDINAPKPMTGKPTVHTHAHQTSFIKTVTV